MKKKVEKKKDLESLIDFLNDGVYTVDLENFLFTSVNNAGEAITGYKSEELVGLPFAKLVVPKYLPLVKKMISQKQKKGISTIFEIEIIKKDGTLLPVEISSRIIIEDGKPVKILGIARDISERKLHQNQKDIFIGLISHEIKNPLTSIKLYTELLQRTHKRHKKSQKHFEIVMDQVKVIERLMEDFLEVTQMQLGQFTIIKEKFDICKEIKDVIKAYQKLSEHQIKIKGNIKTFVNADRRRIKQVLANLVSNAIKYSPEGKEVVIHVSEGKKGVLVGVQDFGMGIPKSEQKNIFEIFSRTTHAMKSDIKGHGLGLYICREIIKYHKGKLWVESEVGRGSTFYFSLPSR